MSHNICTGYFLGGNTPTGFRSLFGSACPTEEFGSVYIIKGGPGCGKSTLMKRVSAMAAEKGVLHERVFCSSDPDSLDAVILPTLGTAIFDGTAPHILEPQYPGAFGRMVDLGECWDANALERSRDDIMRLTDGCSKLHRKATDWLMCADVFRRDSISVAEQKLDREKVRSAAHRIYDRFVRPVHTDGTGHESVRLLTAVTPHGVRRAGQLDEDAAVLPVEDSTGAVSPAILSQLRQLLLDGMHDIVTLECSQTSGHIEHILVPAANFAVTTVGETHGMEGNQRVIHAERFITGGFTAVEKRRLADDRKMCEHFTALAAQEMNHALAMHGELEEIYRAAMDFREVDKAAERVLGMIFAG